MLKANKILNIILPIITIFLIFAVWYVFALAIGEAIILPTPFETLKKMFWLFSQSKFYSAFFATLIRSIIAFLISFVVALILAFLSRFFDKAKIVIQTIIPIIRALPTIAVVLLLLLWTSSFVAPIIVTMLVVLPTLYTAILNSLNEDILPSAVEFCKIYKVPKKQQIFKVFLPSLMPDLTINIGAGLSLNLKLMVAAEVLSQTAKSIGLLLNTSKIYYETAELMALVLVVVLSGVLIELCGNLIAKRLRSTVCRK